MLHIQAQRQQSGCTQIRRWLIAIRAIAGGGSCRSFWWRAASELVQIVSSFVIFSALALVAGTASSALAIASCLDIDLRCFQQRSSQLSDSIQLASRFAHLPFRHRASIRNPELSADLELPSSLNHLRGHLYHSVFFKQAIYGCCSS